MESCADTYVASDFFGLKIHDATSIVYASQSIGDLGVKEQGFSQGRLS
jgi:hypothetical protein